MCPSSPTATAVAPVVPSSRLRTTPRSATDDRALHRGGAGAGALRRDERDHPGDDFAQARDVGGEESLHILHRHWLDVGMAFEPRVVISDEREADVAHLELAGEGDLRVLGHIDHVPSARRVPPALGPRREARALDRDYRAALVHLDADFAPHLHRQVAKDGAVRMSGADVHDFRPALEEGVRAAASPVDELIADYELARLNVWLKAA